MCKKNCTDIHLYCTLKYKSNTLIKKKLAAIYLYQSASVRGICTRKCEQILCPGTFILFYLLNQLRGYSEGSCGLQKSYRRTDGRTDIKCLSNGRKNLITLKDQTKLSTMVFRFFIEGRVEGVGGWFCNPQLLNQGRIHGGRTRRAPP
jgi:hypothetical protein